MSELGRGGPDRLSVEPRRRRLCVFMPPQAVEDYLELIAAAEARPAPSACRSISSYAPPMTLGSTWCASLPIGRDRGQHPSGHSWDDCVAITETVYEEATAEPPPADKFMIDGATPAPAAATMWWSAGDHASTVRFCADDLLAA